MSGTCGGNCDCSPCRGRKSYDEVCERTSRQILEIDAEHDAILAALEQSSQVKFLRKTLAEMGGGHVSIGGVEASEAVLRARLERIVSDRQQLLATLCSHCPEHGLCSTGIDTEGKSHAWHKDDPDEADSLNELSEFVEQLS